ncbi:hypothetical protein PYW08_007208 [Mythimna loreyi]|uniref:Uncharacterized protein n=1 Tax=Mythimna loreyi TaxID=667449 RepID=A0ACC2R9P8_9NEOP|nr:hypothetical protein PYW08_007208 [Mythimna loreyi]
MKVQNERSMFAKPKIPPPKFQLNNFGFRSFIEPKKIETYVPGPGDTFKAHSIRSKSFSSNNNGKVIQGGSIDTVVNDNGRVDKQHYCFGTPPC